MPLSLPTPMGELLRQELDLLVARLRNFTPTRYAAAAQPWGTRADVLWHLANRLVVAAGVNHELPPLPDMALADVLAVTGHDLCRVGPDEPLAAAALAEILLHRYEVDAQLPGPRVASAVLSVLVGPASAPTPEGGEPVRLLRAARVRCPRHPAAAD